MDKTTINNMKELETLGGLRDFFTALVREEQVCFHPDNDFSDYINMETGEPTYTPEEAQHRDELMTQAFWMCENIDPQEFDFPCEKDDIIYYIANQIMEEYTNE